jgi:phenylalanyl-tRNA synthetase alpha chain
MKWKGKWLEMGGAGLVNPKVFEAVGVDPKEWQGFAFGFGIDRLVMLKFGIDDVRYLYNGDLRLINQF